MREVNARRIGFAESLLSSTNQEVRRLLVRARAFAERWGKPVRLWMSDKQDAFVRGIAGEFPNTPHRYCSSHFLRDLAQPMEQADSPAKVQVRQQVRGLRAIERAARAGRQKARVQAQADKGLAAEKHGAAESATARGRKPAPARPQRQAAAAQSEESPPAFGTAEDGAAPVVLDYCGGVRGILNDDQGGPLWPAGIRRAAALKEVRAALQRNRNWSKPGRAHGQLARLAGCIDRGLGAVTEEQERLKGQVEPIRAVAEILQEENGPRRQRQARYGKLPREYQKQGGDVTAHRAQVRSHWAGGLFVRVRVPKGEQLPTDNDELERWFRKPQGHARRIHGRKHAGTRIVPEGPTLLPTRNAHEAHPEPFTAAEWLADRHAWEPVDQREAIQRRKIMGKARSKKSAANSCPS